MRIAIVTTSYPADADDGAGCFVRAEALRLRSRGEVHVICPRPGAEDDGIAIHPVGGGAAFGWPGAIEKLRQSPWLALSAMRFALAARRRLRRLRPDHVQAHWLLPCAVPIALGLERVEVVGHGGDLRLLGRLPAPAQNALVGAAIGKTGSLRFVSARARDALLTSIDPRVSLRSYVEPCALGPLGTRRPRDEVRRAYGLSKGVVVCIIGRLVAAKGIDRSLEALRGADVEVVVVGDGPERARLEALAGPGVGFVGQLPRSRALDLLAASDVFLDASRAEGAPTAVREARSLEVPVLSCGAGDVALWAARDAGITLVDPDHLGAEIRSWLGSRSTPDGSARSREDEPRA